MKRPSAPLVISLVALFFSLGGAGLANGRSAPTARSASVSTVIVHGPVVTMCPAGSIFRVCTLRVSSAICPAGTHALGGGWDLPPHDTAHSPVSNATPSYNTSSQGVGWIVEMINNDRTSFASFRAVAVCG